MVQGLCEADEHPAYTIHYKGIRQLYLKVLTASCRLTFVVVLFVVLDESAVSELSGDDGQIALRHLAIRFRAEREPTHVGDTFFPSRRRKRSLYLSRRFSSVADRALQSVQQVVT